MHFLRIEMKAKSNRSHHNILQKQYICMVWLKDDGQGQEKRSENENKNPFLIFLFKWI